MNPAQLVRLSAGTEPRLEQCGALGDRLDMDRRVKFLGSVEHDQMRTHSSLAGFFALPPRRENFGLVLAKAMAYRPPLVATTAAAIPEIVDDGVTGLLLPPNDPEALANTITSLSNDPGKTKAMAAHCRERPQQHLTWDEVAERVIEDYHRLS